MYVNVKYFKNVGSDWKVINVGHKSNQECSSKNIKFHYNIITIFIFSGDINKDGELKRQPTTRALPRRLSEVQIKAQEKPIPEASSFFIFSKTNW